MKGPWSLGVCTHWIGAERRYCRSVESVRAFLPGPRCPLHSPAALAGKPEAPDTGAPSPASLPPSPIAASRVADQRAIASGRRRSSPHSYRAAQAAVNRKETQQ